VVFLAVLPRGGDVHGPSATPSNLLFCIHFHRFLYIKCRGHVSCPDTVCLSLLVLRILRLTTRAMVNIFSFFTGKKKKSKRSSWTATPTQAGTAHLASTSSSTYAASTLAQQSVKRQTSRFLSLRTRSSSKMIESSEDALRRQSSIGSMRRKASRRSVSTALPKFGFENDNGGPAEESLGGQLGVSGATLGLENLVGPPKLRESEVAVIYAVELSVDEVKACWDTFGNALRDTGKLTIS
jgi:hypothetical protein